MSFKNIKAAFLGHRHISTTVLLDDSWRNFPVFFCGNFSYHREFESADSFYGNVHSSFPECREKQWGYRIFEINKGKWCTEYISI